MKRQNLRTLCVALLAGWCLLFARCDTTEKSMVRGVYLAQTGPGAAVGLLYQAPEAAADASDASAALQLQWAQGDTLEKALSAAQELLPQTADYRLCDYLLLDRSVSEELLADYEETVLQRAQGRTAAKVCVLEMSGDMTGEFPDKLLEKLKALSARMPRLCRHREGMLLPQLCAADGKVEAAKSGLLWNGGTWTELDAAQTEMARLLLGQKGPYTFWLEGVPVTLRRCSVSAEVRDAEALLRLDCQLDDPGRQPDAVQRGQLARLCAETVQSFWQQGIDLVHLQQRSALQNGVGREKITIKNACPQLQADVRILPW